VQQTLNDTPVHTHQLSFILLRWVCYQVF